MFNACSSASHSARAAVCSTAVCTSGGAAAVLLLLGLEAELTQVLLGHQVPVQCQTGNDVSTHLLHWNHVTTSLVNQVLHDKRRLPATTAGA